MYFDFYPTLSVLRNGHQKPAGCHDRGLDPDPADYPTAVAYLRIAHVVPVRGRGDDAAAFSGGDSGARSRRVIRNRVVREGIGGGEGRFR